MTAQGDAQLAYLAGLFDGEGCIVIKLRHGVNVQSGLQHASHYISCVVGMTSPLGLQRFADRFGGRIRSAGRQAPNRQPVLIWEVASVRAYQFLLAIRPWLIVKAPQADLAIRFHETKRRYRTMPDEERNKRQAFKQAISNLNKGRT